MNSCLKNSPASPVMVTGKFCLGLFLVSLIPAMMLFPWISHVWVNVPFHDDWGTPGHQLVLMCQGRSTLAQWFAQHNESRPFFPRLVFIPLAWWGGWDVRRVMCATFAMVGVAALLLHGVVRRLPGINRAGILALSLVMNVILFWPNSEIWTYSNNFMLVWPPVALLCALLVNLSGIPLLDKVLWNSFFATLATWSWANGMALWLLAVPVSLRVSRVGKGEGELDGKQAGWYLVYAAAGVVNLLFYFHGYRRPSDSPPFSFDPGKLAGYFFTWAGAFFGDEGKALWLGVFVCGLFLALACVSLRMTLKERDFTGCYPWLALGFYAVASGAVASMGRSGFGNSQAMAPHYTAASCYLYIAVAGMGWQVWRAIYEKCQPERRMMPRLATTIAVVMCVPFLGRSYLNGARMLKTTGEHRHALLAAWEWSKVLPDNPALALLLPNKQILETFGSVLESHGVLRVTRWEPGATAHWDYKVKATDTANGVFAQCDITPDEWLEISGWACRPGRAGAADYVVLTACEAGGVPRPWTILPADLASPAVAAALNDGRMGRSGFHMGLPMAGLPKGRVSIQAWAVDVKAATIRPLARTFIIAVR